MAPSCRTPTRLRRALIPLKDNIPTARFPILTVLLIAVNIAVFAWQLTFSSDDAANSELRRARCPGARPEHARVRRDSLPAHPSRQGVRPRGGAQRQRPRAPRSSARARLSTRRPSSSRDQGRAVPAARLAPLVGDGLHLDVHARRHPAHRLQHAVPVDLRQQRRGLDGPAAIPALLPAGRDRRRLRAGAARHERHRAGDRRQRRGRGGARRLPAPLSRAPAC